MADQLALEVDPACAVRIVERRGGEERTLRVGPLAEPDARALATLLLNRTEEPPADGPWRCAVAGGWSAIVSLERHGLALTQPQTGHGAVPRWASSCAAMRSCSASGASAGSPLPPIARHVVAVELVLAAVGAVGRHGARVAARLALRDALQRGRGVAARRGRRAVASASCALGAAVAHAERGQRLRARPRRRRPARGRAGSA